MAFIGVIAENKDEVNIKRILENNLNAINKKHTIILINEKSIENIRNIKFDSILAISLKNIDYKCI